MCMQPGAPLVGILCRCAVSGSSSSSARSSSIHAGKAAAASGRPLGCCAMASPISFSGWQGWQGRGVARVAGRQNAATPAGPLTAKKMTGSLFEPKNHPSHPQYWTRTMTITVMIGFLHRFTKTLVSNLCQICIYLLLKVFSNISIQKYFQNPDPDNGRAGPGWARHLTNVRAGPDGPGRSG